MNCGRILRREGSPRTGRRLPGSLLSITIIGLAIGAAATPVFAAGILPPRNPRTNIAPKPDYTISGTCSASGKGWRCANPCVTAKATFPAYSNGAKCTGYILRALDAARRKEHLRPMGLPSNWFKLNPPEQLFVLADLERVARGLPPYLGINKALKAEAQLAARHDADPTEAPGFPIGVDPQGDYGMGGAWADGFSTLAADYGWMYEDGWGGNTRSTFNLACTSAKAAACWAHRDELLGFDPAFNPGVGLHCRDCEMGTGFAVVHGLGSFVDLVELPAGKAPPVIFSWARDVEPYLPKHR